MGRPAPPRTARRRRRLGATAVLLGTGALVLAVALAAGRQGATATSPLYPPGAPGDAEPAGLVPDADGSREGPPSGLAARPFGPGAWAGTISLRDVPYGPDPAQRLDVHLPAGPGDRYVLGQPRPVLVWIHGGSWQGGDKAYAVPDLVVAQIPRASVAVVSINYRLVSSTAPGWRPLRPVPPGTGTNEWPAAIEDVDRALRWVKTEGRQVGLDPDRVVVWGHSAGGMLAAMAAVAPGAHVDPALHEAARRVDPEVLAYASYGGRMSLGAELGAHPSGEAAVEALLGCGAGPCPLEVLEAASAVAYLDGDDPPGWVACGRRDTLVPCRTQAAPFAALAALARGDLGRLPGQRGVRLDEGNGDHGMSTAFLDVGGFEAWLDGVLAGTLR